MSRKLLLVILSFFLITPVFADTGSVDPNGDVAKAWWDRSTGTTGWNLLDDCVTDGTRQPTAPSNVTTDYIQTTGDPDTTSVDDYDMTTLTVDSFSSVVVWAYGAISDSMNPVYADICVSGTTWIGVVDFGFVQGAAKTWKSATFTKTGTPWTQTNLNYLRIRLQADATAAAKNATIYAMYGAITYSYTPPSGQIIMITGDD